MDVGNLHPEANPCRSDAIEIKAMTDGYIVHQPERDRIHYLNHTAALVLELCTGRVSVEDISRMIGDAFDLTEPPADYVETCVERLIAKELMVPRTA